MTLNPTPNRTPTQNQSTIRGKITKAHNLAIVTPDPAFSAYPVKIIW